MNFKDLCLITKVIKKYDLRSSLRLDRCKSCTNSEKHKSCVGFGFYDGGNISCRYDWHCIMRSGKLLHIDGKSCTEKLEINTWNLYNLDDGKNKVHN